MVSRMTQPLVLLAVRNHLSADTGQKHRPDDSSDLIIGGFAFAADLAALLRRYEETTDTFALR